MFALVTTVVVMLVVFALLAAAMLRCARQNRHFATQVWMWMLIFWTMIGGSAIGLVFALTIGA